MLVVDEESLFRERIATRLENGGARVYQAESLFEAIDCLERPHIDVVICNDSLPHARGADLLAHLRHRGFPIGFVLMSLNLRIEAAAEAWRQDALAISKPCLLRLL